MRNLRFVFPSQRAPLTPWWVLASAVLHGTAAAALVMVAGPSFVPTPPTYIVLTDPRTPGPREVVLPPFGPAIGESEGDAGSGPVEGDVATRQVSLSFLDSLPPIAPPDTVFTIGGIPSEDVGEDSFEGEGPIGTGRRLGPAYAGGLLWVRPFEVELGIVGPSETRVIHLARLDSAIRDRIKAYIDTMPRDSFALPPPPVWTTQIDGSTFGIDQQWVYLGDFKIPTALLALLPLPQGNYDRAKEAQELMRVRQDIIRAARASQDAKEFRRYVDELRKRKEAERDRQRARTDTVTVKPLPPP